jgi:hypothetical protein
MGSCHVVDRQMQCFLSLYMAVPLVIVPVMLLWDALSSASCIVLPSAPTAAKPAGSGPVMLLYDTSMLTLVRSVAQEACSAPVSWLDDRLR